MQWMPICQKMKHQLFSSSFTAGNLTLALASALVAVLLLSTPPSARAEESPDRHWFQFTITVGQSTETITGSSTHDLENMKIAAFDNSNPVELEDIREQGMFDSTGVSWRANTTVKQICIMPRSIVYFCELAEDPLTKKK